MAVTILNEADIARWPSLGLGSSRIPRSIGLGDRYRSVGSSLSSLNAARRAGVMATRANVTNAQRQVQDKSYLEAVGLKKPDEETVETDTADQPTRSMIEVELPPFPEASGSSFEDDAIHDLVNKALSQTVEASV